jgi:hypothetical protein
MLKRNAESRQLTKDVISPTPVFVAKSQNFFIWNKIWRHCSKKMVGKIWRHCSNCLIWWEIFVNHTFYIFYSRSLIRVQLTGGRWTVFQLFWHVNSFKIWILLFTLFYAKTATRNTNLYFFQLFKKILSQYKR